MTAGLLVATVLGNDDLRALIKVGALDSIAGDWTRPMMLWMVDAGGVTNMKLAFGECLGFASPVDGVKDFLNHRDAFAYDNDNPSNPFRYLEPPRKVLFRGILPDKMSAEPASE